MKEHFANIVQNWCLRYVQPSALALVVSVMYPCYLSCKLAACQVVAAIVSVGLQTESPIHPFVVAPKIVCLRGMTVIACT